MTPTTEELRTRAEAGGYFLDNYYDDWFHEIDLDLLEMWSRCNCVLGQLFGDFFDALGVLEMSRSLAQHFGFFLFDEEVVHSFTPYRELEDIWRELITARRA